MNKGYAMKKVHVLWGSARLVNKTLQEKWETSLNKIVKEKAGKIGSLNYKLKTTPGGASIEMGKIANTLKQEEARYEKKIKDITSKIDYWKQTNARYTFTLEAT